MGLRAFVVLVGVTVAGGVKLGEPAYNGASDENVERAAALADEASDNMGWMRAFSGECKSCLKECLGIRAQKLQQNVGKFQAPFSLITWYLFQNRPFKMWPIEDLFRGIANVHPGVYGSGAAVMYMTCQSHCDAECPYPGVRPPTADDVQMPELDDIDPSDLSFLSRMLYRGGSRRGGGGGAGGIGDAMSKIFQIV